MFPNVDSILSFARPRSVSALNSSFQENRVIAVFTQKNGRIEDPGGDDVFRVGTIATITQMMSSEGEIHTVVRGHARVELLEIIAQEPHLVGKIREIPEQEVSGPEVEALSKNVVDLFKKAVDLGKHAEITTVMKILSRQTSPVELVDSVAHLLEIKTADKQRLLETDSVLERLKKVNSYVASEVNVLDLERVISMKTQKRFEDQMRKAMLREKKRTIEKELGEGGDDEEPDDEIGEYRQKIKKAKMPPDVRSKANKELKRLSKLTSNNPESGYIRNYLDWLTEIPWSVRSKSNISIAKASKILEEDHYGLEKVKERVIEYLSVLQLKSMNAKKAKYKKNKKGDDIDHPTILCFVGPPGVGKTSIGKSIASALGREFVRMSLGGVRDEAEIRGHRRTYIGAMPGRIIQSIKNAGTKNPVFMLDEIDKLGVDYRGDPSSALLEILDPEQNREFSDHYLGVSYDLSEVTFICTANILDTVPVPLRDRMEIIPFSGYIEDEKLGIAKRYLWEKQLKVNGLGGKKIPISDKALQKIIKNYTREAGVRELERSLAKVARKIARSAAERKSVPKKITTKMVAKYLGPRRYHSQIAGKSDEVGVSTGLAFTATGGDIIFIEVALMPGKGKLLLTGQLGDIMKESARAAFTWTKSHWNELGLREDFGKNIDVHIHVPEGAIPKDGPSAGVAMATALVSALTGVPTKREVGMTGEITLRGDVLEIGGVKEKTIAGHRAGLKTIILPRGNKKDLEEVPKNIRKDGISFVYARKLDDALSVALTKWPVVRKSAKSRSHLAPPQFISA